MKKICFFSGDITRCGGTERAASLIANGLAGTGTYQVMVLSLVEQNAAPFFPLLPSIERRVLRGGGRWIPPGPGALTYLPKLRRFLRREAVSVLVDVDLVLDALSLPAAAGLPTKIVSWEHFHLDFERQTLYRRIAARLAARFSDYLVTLTPRDAENYREKLGRRKNIQWIYNPLPPELPAWGSGQREPLLVTAGRLEPVKGADLLARLAPSILLRHAGWRWLVLGEGSCRDALEEAARRYGLEDRLLLPGTVLDVANYLRRAALYVQASRTESFGMGLLEALACRTPCVCFDVPYGPAEMIRSGVNGFLIPPFDLEDMEEKISLLIENSSLRERLRENTATGLDKFQLGPILDKWDRLLKQL